MCYGVGTPELGTARQACAPQVCGLAWAANGLQRISQEYAPFSSLPRPVQIHSRLHYLDVERWRQRELSYQRHAATRQQQQQHDQKHQQQQQPQHKQQGPIAAAASAAGHASGQQRYDNTTAELLAYEGSLEHQVGLGVGVEGEEEDEVAEREQARRRAEAEALAKKCGGGGAAALAAAAESGQVAGAGGAGGPGAVGGDEGDETLVSTSPERQGVLRYWDPEVGRQREAKAAMLAIRRHMRWVGQIERPFLVDVRPHMHRGAIWLHVGWTGECPLRRLDTDAHPRVGGS